MSFLVYLQSKSLISLSKCINIYSESMISNNKENKIACRLFYETVVNFKLADQPS